jgi:CheY-like chemotaxis protein
VRDRPVRVLVVDDTASVRQLIRVNLELDGYEVYEAVDGQDCLDRVADIAPDVVTIDVVMPRLDGYATVASLRSNPATARLPVVMVTTQAQAADLRRAAEVGVDAHVSKPFDPDRLADIVEQARAARAETLQVGEPPADTLTQ